MSKIVRNALIMLILIILLTVMSACSEGTNDNETKLSDTEYGSLMEQVAQKDFDVSYYSEYLSHKAFANAEIFGVDRDGDKGTAYVYLYEGDYVALKGKAYNMAGSAGEAILNYNYTDDGAELTELVWSSGGELQGEWLKENFPAKYLDKANSYDPYDENGESVLEAGLKEKIESTLGVPLETESFLEIDVDKGTYKIWRVKDDRGTTFDTETIETGKLEDLR